MLFALRVIPLAVMFRGGAVGLGGVFMMFGCFIMFVSGHLHSSGEYWGDLSRLVKQYVTRSRPHRAACSDADYRQSAAYGR
jgi:hypothetical protein